MTFSAFYFFLSIFYKNFCIRKSETISMFLNPTWTLVEPWGTTNFTIFKFISCQLTTSIITFSYLNHHIHHPQIINSIGTPHMWSGGTPTCGNISIKMDTIPFLHRNGMVYKVYIVLVV